MTEIRRAICPIFNLFPVEAVVAFSRLSFRMVLNDFFVFFQPLWLCKKIYFLHKNDHSV